MTESNKRLVLTITSCIGVAATSVATFFGTKKAIKKVEGKHLTKKEAAKVSWTCFIPTIAIGAGTITAIIFNNKLTAAQMSAIVSSAGLSTKLLHDYEQKAIELYGKEAVDNVKAEVAKDHEDGIVYALVPTIHSEGGLFYTEDIDCGGDELFYDIFRDKWFRSSMSAVRMAEYHLNRNYAICGQVSLADFYGFLGLDTTKADDDLGWGFAMRESDIYWIDFEHTKRVNDAGEEYTIISYIWAPKPWTEDEL